MTTGSAESLANLLLMNSQQVYSQRDYFTQLSSAQMAGRSSLANAGFAPFGGYSQLANLLSAAGSPSAQAPVTSLLSLSGTFLPSNSRRPSSKRIPSGRISVGRSAHPRSLVSIAFVRRKMGVRLYLQLFGRSLVLTLTSAGPDRWRFAIRSPYSTTSRIRR